jgi:c-di-GMP-binding flagellar brake protein YcgR
MGMTSPFPEPQSPELEQFTVYSRAEIAAVLRRLRDAVTPVNAYHEMASGFAVTEILDVLTEDGAVVIDPPSEATAARYLLAAEHVTFVAFIDNVKVQFSAQGVVAASWQGRPAVRVKLPESLLRLQRREYFRIRPPVAKPAMCLIPHPPEIDKNGYVVARAQQRYESLRVLDLSVGGLALLSYPAKFELPHGGKIDGCFLDLPGVGSINLSLTVHHIDPVPRDEAARRLGCEFADMSPASRMALQRYVNKIEAEARKALSQAA